MDALDGAPACIPGATAAANGDDEANNDKLLRNWRACLRENGLRAVRQQHLCAHTWRALAAVFDGVPGPRGLCAQRTNGFGNDPLFIPDEVGVLGGGERRKTRRLPYAESFGRGKDAISHRGCASHGAYEAELARFLAVDGSHRHDVRERMHHGGGQGGGLTRKMPGAPGFNTRAASREPSAANLIQKKG